MKNINRSINSLRMRQPRAGFTSQNPTNCPQFDMIGGRLGILLLFLGVSISLSGCGANGDATGGGVRVAGTIVPDGSPEYQALGKEACDLLNSSRATMKTIAASNSAGTKMVIHTTMDMQGRNARFTSPSVLTTETHTHMTYQDKLNPSSSGVNDSSVRIQIDLKNIKKIAVIDNVMKGIVDKTDTVAGINNSKFWKVMVVGGASMTDGNGNPFPDYFWDAIPTGRDMIAVANFDHGSKAKADRLCAVLKKMSELAKAN